MSDTPKNLMDELKAAENAALHVKEQDPETVEAVKEYLRAQGEEIPGSNTEEQEDQTQTRVHIAPNPEFQQGDPQQATISDVYREAFVSLKDVPITDRDRTLFIKSAVNDEPVRMDISLMNGNFVTSIRARSVLEQRRVFDAVEQDRKDGLFTDGNMAMAVTRMHYYLAALMVERINGKAFSELQLDGSQSLENDIERLREIVSTKIENMSGIRWSVLLNALRIFDHKCARLNEEAANADFWPPLGSAL